MKQIQGRLIVVTLKVVLLLVAILLSLSFISIHWGLASSSSHSSVPYNLDSHFFNSPQLISEFVFPLQNGAYSLNLRVMDWDLTDAISDAYVFMDNGTENVQVSDANGWANFTGVSGLVSVKVKYCGFWVNGTFSLTVSEDTTLDVLCNLFDVTVKVVEAQQSAYLVGANVTVFNATSSQENRIATAITGSDGMVILDNLPNNTLTFTLYGGSSYTVVIGNETQQVSSDDLSLTVTANQNGTSADGNFSLIVFVAFVLPFKEKVHNKLKLKFREKRGDFGD